MNKKVVLSVLATAVVASMAASAFAAPKTGLYIGGNVKKFYSNNTLLNMTKDARATYKNELKTAGFQNLVYVNVKGQGATIKEMIDLGTKVAMADPLKQSDFSDLYSVVNNDGTISGTEDARSKVDPVDTGEVKVESVTAINLKQVVVTFDKELDADSATTLANYTFTTTGTGVLGGTPVLSADKKSVTLTLTTAATNQDNGTLVVKEVKSATGAKVAETSKSISFLDTTLPSVVSAKLTGPTKVQIKFSEPVTAGTLANAAFSVDNNTYSLGVAPVLVAGTLDTIEITLGSVLPNGQHTIKVNPAGTAPGNQIKDFAGFAVPTTDVSFNYVADTVAPVATLKSVTQTTAEITFDKAVSFAGAGVLNTDFTVFHTINNQPSYKGTAVLAADGKTLTVTFPTPLPAGSVSIYLNNTTDATKQLQDAFGNKVANSTLTATITNDTTPPTVTAVKAVDSTHVDVTFSEAVTGVDASDFTLKDSANAPVLVTQAVQQGTTNTYRLTTAALNGDTYTLSIKADSITDTALVPNKIAAYTTTFTVADTAAPIVTPNGSFSADLKKVFVSFNEKMATTGTGSVLDVNNYRLASATGTNPSALPAGTTISIGADGKSVVINFPTAVAGLGTGNLAGVLVGQVRDLAGNPTDSLSNLVTIATADLTGASIIADSVKAISKNTIQFKLNANLNAIDVNKFTIDGVQATGATYVNGAGESTVTVTAPADKWQTDLSDLDANAIQIAQGGLTNDQNVSNGSTITVAKADVADYVAPTIVTREIADTNANGKYDTVTVTFSEALQASSVAFDSFTVEGYTVLDVNVTGAAATIKVKELTSNDVGASVKVQLVKSVRDASDQRNAIVAETSGTVATDITPAPDNVPPVIAAVADANVPTATIPVWVAPPTTALDNVDGPIANVNVAYSSDDNGATVTDLVSARNHLAAVVGNTVKVTYTVSDAAGNAATPVTATFTSTP
ncbi:hypothetical protein KM924_14075 [Brevibacillus parabrevis]|uniref:beta strand repeat-containing protein n=1 Tax=Brevibacillus parabrevis TaxID=54914 RepID=UPI001C225CFF|nr:hypothetical protein [Brevibacillus parabrevis]MBU8713633.1 hypothetical protein [Brevibacillus parabrevis]